MWKYDVVVMTVWLLQCSSLLVDTAKVTKVSPQYTSMSGGGRLIIEGEGFPGNQFSQTKTDTGIVVELVDPVGHLLAGVIHPDGCTDTRIAFYTPAGMKQDVRYDIRVKLDGTLIPSKDHCADDKSKCKVTATYYYTPRISSFVKQTGLADENIELWGRIVTLRYGADTITSSNGITQRITRVYAPSPCLLKNGDDFYKLVLDSETSVWGSMQCKPEETFVGNANFTFLVESPFGRAITDANLQQVTKHGDTANYQFFANITGMSYTSGSKKGGQNLTLTIPYADDAANQPAYTEAKVFIGGKRCSEIYVTPDVGISVIVPEEMTGTGTTYFSGNRGVNVDYFDTPFANEDEAATSADSPSGSEHFDTAEFCGHTISQKYTRMKGVFTVWENGTYVWFFKATNGGKLYLGGDGTGTTLATSYGGRAKSATFTATVGDQFAFTAVAKDGTDDDACVQVGVKNLATQMSWIQSGWNKKEEQKLKITSTPNKESMALKFKDFDASAARKRRSTGATSEVQKICLTDNEAPSAVRLCMFGVCTKPNSFSFGDTTKMAPAISDLPCFQTGDTVTVETTTASSGTCVLVTINSNRGDFPPFTSDSTNVVVNEETGGVAGSTYVSLKMNDGISPVIEYSSDNSVFLPKLKAALITMYSTRCPALFAPDTDFEDFEDSSNDYNENKIQPFCGRFSRKNKGTKLVLFQGDKNIELVKWLCFAMLNVTNNNLYLSFTPPSDNRRNGRGFVLENILTTPMEEGGWKYVCTDIYTLMKDDSKKSGGKFKLHEAWLRNGDDTIPFYADAVAFRKTNPIDGLSSISMMRLNPAFPNSNNKFFIRTIDVQYRADTDDYKVDIDPFDCGTAFAPLTVDGAQASGSASVLTYKGSHEWSVEVTGLTDATPPTEGTFKVSFRNQNSNSLSATMSDDELKTALEGIKGMKTMGVKTSDDSDCHNREVILTFEDMPGDLPLMTVGSKAITPNGADVTIEDYREGGMEINPLTADYVSTYHVKPQVVAEINGVYTRCDVSAGCGYDYSTDQTPTVTGINPTSGNIGLAVTITGTGFGTGSGDNTVAIGQVSCDVKSQTSTTIECDLNNGPVGQADVKVHVAGKGFSTAGTFTYTAGVMSVSPSTGGRAGGLPITLTGNGFSDQSIVSVGTNGCPVVSSTVTKIVCTLPEASDQSAESEVTVSVSGGTDTVTFTYDSSAKPTISSINHDKLTVAGGQTITMSGSSFGSATGTAHLGTNSLTVSAWSPTSVVMTTPTPTVPGQDLLLSVVVPDVSWATQSDNSRPDIDVELIVNNVSPGSGSVYGGTNIKFEGTGFGTDPEAVSASAGDYEIKIETVTNTMISGYIGSTSTVHNIANIGQGGQSYLDITEGDEVIFSWTVPEVVEDGTYTIMQTDSITGTAQKSGSFAPPRASPSGSVKVGGLAEGVYFYWSGPMSETIKMEHRTTVNVTKAIPRLLPISVKVSNHEARHVKADASSSGQSASCSPVTTNMKDCTPATLTAGDDTKIYFHLSECRSPVIDEVKVENATMNPRSIIASSLFTIKGSGLASTDCANIASVSDCSCQVKTASSSDSEFMCQLDSSCAAPAGQLLPVTVSVLGFGYGFMRIPLAIERSVVIVPALVSIAPAQGSRVGGTTVALTGTHLDIVNYVSFNGATAQCNYGQEDLTCTSPISTTGTVVISTDSGDGVCNGQCEYTYSPDDTPSVTSVVPSTVSGATTLTVSGSKLSTDATKLTVRFGDTVPCLNLKYTDDGKFECEVDALPAGPNTVHVHVEPFGYASTAVTVSGEATTPSPIPDTGSIYGGTQVKISAHGFHGETHVNASGASICESLTSTLTEIICTTKAAVAGAVKVNVTSNGQTYDSFTYTYSDDSSPTISSVNPMVGIAGDVITISGSHFSAVPSEVTVSTGESNCVVKSASEAAITCQLGSASSGEHTVLVGVSGKGRSNGDKKITYQHSITGISPPLGDARGSQVLTVSGHGFTCDSTVEVGSITCEVFSCSTTSLECVTPPNDAGTSSDVKVTEDGRSQTATDQYTYSAVTTVPTITAVTPNMGGTGGGTQITVTGTGFSDPMTVSIADSTCTVTSVTATEIQCTTGAHSGTTTAAVLASDASGLRAFPLAPRRNEFRYIDRWSSTNTWGGEDPGLPKEGEMVVIGAGHVVLLDTDTPVLSLLLIDGGSVIVADGIDVTLRAKNILINNGGLLQVGTWDTPHLSKATIELHGDRSDHPLPLFGSKGIFVLVGTLDLHGEPKTTWTVLGETANIRDKTIILKEPVNNWRVGDHLVIATTGSRFSQGETEEKEIESISDDRREITLTEVLEYKHLAVTETYSTTFGEQDFHFVAEVGNLHRTVTVKGVSNPAFNKIIEACPAGFNPDEFATQTCFQGKHGQEEDSDQFGAIVTAASPNPDKNQTHLFLSYAQFSYMGQAFLLGRYPIHFHILKNASGSYVIGCAIHKSHNRAVNIHGTHNVLVSLNVFYNIMGAGAFLEDGVETNNVFSYNLAIFVRSSSSLLNEDATPASFWITNPANVYVGNSVAGGTHHGFWIRVHLKSEGPSQDPTVCPQKIELKVFANNTAHSLGKFGVWTFENYFPMVGGGCDEWSTPAAAMITGHRSYHTHKAIEIVIGGHIGILQLISVADRVCTEHKENKLVPKGNDIIPGIKDVYCAARAISDEVHAAAGTENIHGGIVVGFGEGHQIVNVAFARYGNIPVLSGTSIDGTCTTFCNGESVIVKNITMYDSDVLVKFRWQHEFIMRYESASGEAGTLLAKTEGLPDKCPTFSQGKTDGQEVVLCDKSYKFHKFGFNEVTPSSLQSKNATLTNKHGKTTSVYASKRIRFKKGNVAGVLSYETYTLEWDEVAQANRSFAARLSDFGDKDCVIIGLKYTDIPDKVTLDGGVTHGNFWSTPFTCDDNFDALSLGDWYFQDGFAYTAFVQNGHECTPRYDLKMGPQISCDNIDFHYSAYKCFYKGCITPPEPGTVPPKDSRPAEHWIWSTQLWSKRYVGDRLVEVVANTSAPNLDSYQPVEGDNVTIPADGTNWVVVKDQNPPPLRMLKLFGVLEIDFAAANTGDLTYELTVTYLVIIGGRLVAGWPNNPMVQPAVFNLNGGASAQSVAIPEIGNPIMPGSIAAYGGVDIHGKVIDNTWLQLTQTAAAGSRELHVAANMMDQWRVGWTVIITTTSNNPDQTEEGIIAAVNNQLGKITLTKGLSNTHTGYWEATKWSHVNFGAAVSLKDRTVKIQGTNSFIAVSTTEYDGYSRTGWARISYTAFLGMGQEAFSEAANPRMPLAYFEVGDVNEIKPSSVIGNSFYNTQGTAIGAFDIGNLIISNNTVHKVVGHGIVTTSRNTTLHHNLMSTVLWPGSWNNRKETFNFRYNAGIMAMSSTLLRLTENMVVGSQRIGYRVPGEDCSSSVTLYRNNLVTGCLINIGTPPGDNIGAEGACIRFTGFISSKARDYGFFFEGSGSLQLTDSIFAENQVGVMILMIGPSALSHICGTGKTELTNVTVIGHFTNSNCAGETPPSGDFMVLSSKCRGMMTDDRSRIGLVFPTYQGGPNMAFEKPCDNDMAYNAKCGTTIFKDLVFINFGPHSTCKNSVAISTNGAVDDAHHPLKITNTNKTNVADDNYINFFDSAVGRINPSDCVDMECDGHKQTFVFDADGSLTGTNVPVTLFPKRLYWDDQNNRNRGIGTYRIPKAQLTAHDGSMYTIDEIASKGVGIPWDGECVEKAAISGVPYIQCKSANYKLLMIESMDEDTESRRLSPISVLSESGYIDLINGPQDHGWCSGYTCQRRISTFTVVIVTGQQTKIYLSSTQPEIMKYFMQQAADTDCAVLVVYYDSINRVDLYKPDSAGTGTENMLPTNAYRENGKVKYNFDPTANYKPSCSDPHGTNYVDRDNKLIYFVLKGNAEVQLKKTELILVSFDLPQMTEEEFFGPALVTNLALFLKVPFNKIRLVNIVSGSASRRRRSTGLTASFEVGDEPTGTITETTTVPIEAAAALMTGCQSGLMGDALGTEVGSCEQIIVSGIEYTPVVPVELRFEVSPTAQHEGVPFAAQPKIRAYDSNGNVVGDLGIAESPWQITVTLRSGTGHASAVLSGATTLSSASGWFNFTDLAISHAGSGYIIDFDITDPAGSNLTTTVTMDVDPVPMTVGVHSMTTTDIEQGSIFALNFDLRDSTTGEVIQDITWRNHIFAVTCGEVMSSGNLTGTFTDSFDDSTGRVEFDNWAYASYGFIYITCRVVSSPPEYDFNSYHEVVILSHDQMGIPIERTENVVVRFNVDYQSTLPTPAAAAQLHQATLQFLGLDNPYIIIRSSTITEGSIVITFTVEGSSSNVTDSLASICSSISGGAVVTVGGTSLQLDGYMTVDGSNYYASCGQTSDSEEGLHPGYIALIVVVCLIVLAAIVLLIVWLVCIKPKKKIHELEEMNNGRTVFLAGAPNKMANLQAPINTSLYEHGDKAGLRHTPLPVKNNGLLTPEQTALNLRKQNTSMSIGQQGDIFRAITPTS